MASGRARDRAAKKLASLRKLRAGRRSADRFGETAYTTIYSWQTTVVFGFEGKGREFNGLSDQMQSELGVLLIYTRSAAGSVRQSVAAKIPFPN